MELNKVSKTSMRKLAAKKRKLVEQKVERLRKFLMDEVEALESGVADVPSLIIFTNWLDEEVYIHKEYETDEATALVEELGTHHLWKGISYGIDAMVAMNIRDEYFDENNKDGNPWAAIEFMRRMRLTVDKAQMEKDFLGYVSCDTRQLVLSDPMTIEDLWHAEDTKNIAGQSDTMTEISEVLGSEENSGTVLDDDAMVIKTVTSGDYPVFAYRNDQGDILRIEINLNPWDYEEEEWYDIDKIDQKIEKLLDHVEQHKFLMREQVERGPKSGGRLYAVSNSNVLLGLSNGEDFYVEVGEVFNVLGEVMVHDEVHLVLERLDGNELGMEPFLIERRFCELCGVKEILTTQESAKKAYDMMVAEHQHSGVSPSTNVIPFRVTNS